MYIFDEVKIGRLEYLVDLNRYQFEIVEFNECYLKRLKYDVVRDNPHKDKIVYVNHKIICIRNNDKLVYGSLILQPSVSTDLMKFDYNTNIHMKVLNNYYNFKFFTPEYVTECLKMDKKYWVYMLINTGINNLNEKGAWGIKFILQLTEQFFGISQKEFLEYSGYPSDVAFLDQFKITLEAIKDERKRDKLSRIHDIIQNFNSNTQSFDTPSRIFYLHCASDISQKTKLRSDIILCAGISDQQDFLFQRFLKTNIPMNFPSWTEMKRYCVIYWYNDLDKIRGILDKGSMIRYKQNKDVFEVLFWFVLLGKQKLLVPLFKLEQGQEKFVNFFSLDFSEPKNVEKAINNAFVLKSQKKFELSAAFFLLAKQYTEAIDLLISYSNDVQLAILIYRLFENTITQDKHSWEKFMELIDLKFIKHGEEQNDYFMMAIGYMIIKDYENMIKAIMRYKNLDKIVCIKPSKESKLEFGFLSCNYSPYYLKILSFIEYSPSFKRFIETEDSNTVLVNNFYKATLSYYMNSGDLYRCLETIVEYKATIPDDYESFISENKRLIYSCLNNIAMKKIKFIIERGTVWKLSDAFQHIKSWFDFFNLDFRKFIKIMAYRIYLLNDLQLSLLFNLSYASNAEVVTMFKENLDNLLHKCGKLLRVDILSYKNKYKYLKGLNYARSVIKMLNDLFLVTDHNYIAKYTEQRADFNEVMALFIFLLMLKSHNWAELLHYIERCSALDVLEEDFQAIINQCENWVAARFNFCGERKVLRFNDKECTYTNLNLICTLYLQNILFYSYMKIRGAYMGKGNIIEDRLSVSLKAFEIELKTKFINLLNSHAFADQIEIIDELNMIFSMDMATLKQQTMSLLNPREAYDLDKNPRIHSKFLKLEVWFDFLYELKLQKVLNVPLRNMTDELLEQKKAFFKNGIEIFKIKQEQGLHLFTKGVITDICIFQTSRIPDVYILVQNKIRKIYLFNSLFKKSRVDDGYTLSFTDDISSISVVNEVPFNGEETHANEKTAFYRILYKMLFGDSKVIDKHSMKVLETLLDLKEQKRDAIASVNAMTNHKKLQILNIASINKFYLLSAKTLATLGKIEVPGIKKIKFIIPDHSGYKLVLIDHNKNAYIVKYSLAFSEITLLASLVDKNVYHASFYQNSTKVLFSSYSTKFFIYDFIEQSVQEHETNNNKYIKNRLIYSPMISRVVFINMAKNIISLVDPNDLSEDDSIDNESNPITAYVMSDLKPILVTGTGNGVVMIFDLKSMECVYQKVYEGSDGRRVRIDSLALLNDFVLSAFSNGVLSIIFKI